MTTKAIKDKYTGSEKNGKRHGTGKCEYVNGDVYEGEWNNGKRHGFGIFTGIDGRRYMGQFSNNNYHGYGTLFISHDKRSDAIVMSGQWINGEAEGLAIVILEDGNSYAGQVSKSNLTGVGCGMMDGGFFAGERLKTTGDAFSLQFGNEGSVSITRKKNDKLHGEQVTYRPDDSKSIYKYNNGIMDPVSYIEMPDGTIVIGEIDVNGILDGEVSILYPDGRKIKCHFEKGMVAGELELVEY